MIYSISQYLLLYHYRDKPCSVIERLDETHPRENTNFLNESRGTIGVKYVPTVFDWVDINPELGFVVVEP